MPYTRLPETLEETEMNRLVLSIMAILAAAPILADETDARTASRIMQYPVNGCVIYPQNAAGEMTDACKALLAIELLESLRESVVIQSPENGEERSWLNEVESYLAVREREGGEAPTSQLGSELYQSVVAPEPEPEVADTPEPEEPGTCEPEDIKPFRGYVMRASYET